MSTPPDTPLPVLHISLLDELHERGVRAHGALLPRDEFEGAVLARVAVRLERARQESTPESAAAALRATSGADLYLVVACDRRVPGAWERLTGAYEPRLRRLGQQIGIRDAEAAVADLFGSLSGPGPHPWARTRLGSYLGAGALFGWLGVGLRRQIATVERRQGSGAHGHPTTRPATTPDPIDRAIGDELAGRLADALEIAWRGLEDRERLVILCKYREGLPQRTIAALLGLSEAWISRIVAQAVTRIRTTLVRHLRHEQPERWRDEEALWQSLMHVMARHLAMAGPLDGDAVGKRRPRD